MKAAEIRTQKDLESWLKDQPQEVCVWIAYRAAARVLPVYLQRAAQTENASRHHFAALPIYRSLLISEAFAYAEDAQQANRLTACAAAADAKYNIRTGAACAAVHSAGVEGADAAAYAAADAVVHATADIALAINVTSSDPRWAEDKSIYAFRALWPDGIPDTVAACWRETQEELPSPTDDQPDYRSFWVSWYQGLLDGKPAFPDSLTCAVALIDPEDWDKGDLHINNVVIPRLMIQHLPPLLQAAPVDFSFDAFARVMRMVGIDDDTAHLRNPALVTSFRDDCEEVEDTLQDFRDYAQTLGGGGNHAAVLAQSVDKVLKELRRTGEKTHLRARYLVGLCRDLETFSKEEKARADLGNTLAAKLDGGINLLQTVTRKHLAPAYTALLPLAQLSVDQVDQDAVVSLFDEMIEWLEHLPDATPVPLDEDGLSVFRDMVREVRDLRAAIAEASSDEFRTMLEGRFAASAGGVGLAVGRLVQRSSAAAGVAGRGADATIRNFERARSLKDIIDSVLALLPGSPP